MPKTIPGGFWLRLVASLIDNAIVMGLQLPLLLALDVADNPLKTFATAWSTQQAGTDWRAASIRFCVAAVFWVAYCAVFYRFKSATPGKLLLGLKVVDLKTGKGLGVGQTILRELVGKWISTLLLGFGYLVVPFRRDKRALHDFIAGTRVQK